MTVFLSFSFSLMLVLLYGDYGRFSFVVLFSIYICGFVIVVVAVDLDVVVMVVAPLLSTFTVITDTVFLFIAGHLFCNKRHRVWIDGLIESITLFLFVICSLKKKYFHLAE